MPTSRSRKSSIADPAAGSTAAPTSFFIASEEQMEKAMARQEGRRMSGGSSHNAVSGKVKDTDKAEAGGRGEISPSSDGSGTYGVQSLEEALGTAFGSETVKGVDKPLDRSGSAKSHSSDGSGESGKKRKRKGRVAAEHENQDTTSGVDTPKHDNGSADSSPQLHQPPIHFCPRRLSDAIASMPLTPVCADSPAYHAGSGIPSTPKSVSLHSLKLSDDGEHEEMDMNDATSQAIASTDDEDEEQVEEHRHSLSAPELVMPSIAMPARRPFTENGKRLGRLKIMVVGPEGVGKTGLIRSIVQICEDIVHVDPTPVPVALAKVDRGSGSRIAEVYASSRAYPSWWSDMEESKILRRRKSMGLGDTVLERNICFIDTPGFTGAEEDDDKNVRYVETLLARNAAIGNLSDADLLSLMSGGGGVQVDVVLYIFGHDEATDQDAATCTRLATLTNVIPLIGKSDTLNSDELIIFKQRILEKLQESNVKPFLFGSTVEQCLSQVRVSDNKAPPSQEADSNTQPPAELQSQRADESLKGSKVTAPNTSSTNLPSTPFNWPCAVSSAPGPDLETMDASLLMSPDYCPPPLPSELHFLVDLLFDPEKAAWLRYSAARKFLNWYRDITTRIMEVPRNPNFHTYGTRSPSHPPWRVGAGLASGALTPNHGLLPLAQRNASRAAAATGHGSISPHSNVPKWAANLSKALRNEREREGKIAWDVDVGVADIEGMQNSSLYSDSIESRKSSSAGKRNGSKVSRKGRHWSDTGTVPMRIEKGEPLDVLAAVERVSSAAWTAVKVLSVVGAAGAVACVMARTWFGIESVTVQWHWT